MALASDQHLLAQYKNESSWTIGYNLFADHWLQTGLISQSVRVELVFQREKESYSCTAADTQRAIQLSPAGQLHLGSGDPYLLRGRYTTRQLPLRQRDLQYVSRCGSCICALTVVPQAQTCSQPDLATARCRI
jgi:hypothetical protein